MNKKVVVLGRNYCNILTTARALGEAGYSVEIIKVFKTKPSKLKFLRTMKPDSLSKYVTSYQELITNGDKNAVVNTVLKLAESEKKLVVPVDDYVCYAIDKKYEKLNDKFFIANINGKSRAIAELMQKDKQKEIAKEKNVPTLNGWLIKSDDGIYEIPDDIKYPCFVKPNVSMRSSKSNMKACKNQDELKRFLDKLSKQGDFEFLCEELADIKQEFSVLGLSDGKKAITAGAFRVLKGGHHDRNGVALLGELISPEKIEDSIKMCNKFVESLNYTGLYDIDLIQDVNDNVYFVEMNFRAGASTYALSKAGVNLFGGFADYMLKNEPIESIEPVNSKKTFISEKILMEEFARGDISFKEIRTLMNSADIFFVKNENDIKPYKYFKYFYLPSILVRISYKIKDRFKK